MIQALIRRVRSYADALFAGFTKTAQDGRKIFYPRGAIGRGYVIASEQDEERLKQKFAVFLVIVSILIVGGQILWGYPGSLGAGALILICYAIYVTRLTANMEPSGEGLSLSEAYSAQARKHSPARLWSWTITGVFLVCFGIAASVSMPENAAKFVFLIVIGGLLAAFSGWMLALRRGANLEAAEPSPAGESVAVEEVGTYLTGDVGPVRTWFITIFGVLATGLFIFLFVIDPEDRVRWAGGIVLFGLIAAYGIAMLVVRHLGRHR